MELKKEEENSSLQSTSNENIRSLCNRGFWCFLILGVLCGFAYHFSNLVQMFLKYEVYTSTQTTTKAFNFPDVTFCTDAFIPNKRSTIRKDPPLYVNRNNSYPNYADDILQKSTMAAWRLALKNSTSSAGESLAEVSKYFHIAKKTFVEEMSISWAGTLPPDLFIGCRYRGKTCEMSQFETVYIKSHTSCIRFSPQNATIYEDDFNMGFAGLVDTDLYPKLSYEDINDRNPSVSVFLTSSDEWPKLDQPDLYLPEASFIDITITPTEIQRLKIPTKHCREPKTLKACMLKYKEGRVCQNFRESEFLCQQLALQRNLAGKCQCISYDYPIAEELIHLPSCFHLPREAYVNRGYMVEGANGTEIVNIRLLNQSLVPASKIIDFAAVGRRYSCHQNWLGTTPRTVKQDSMCELCKSSEIQYVSSTTSMRHYPFLGMYGDGAEAAVELMTATREKYKGTDLPTFFMGRYINTFNAKIVQVNRAPNIKSYFTGVSYFVMKTTLRGKEVKESLRYTMGNLFADMGGTLGVWAGASVLTVFEIIEVITVFISARLKRKRVK